MPIIRTWRRAITRQRRRTQIAVGMLVLVAVAAIGAGIYYVNGPLNTNYLQPNVPSGWSAFGGALHPGDIFDVGIEFGNTSPNGTIILHPVTFPLGLPAHVRLVGEALLRGGLGTARGWPPGRGNTPPDIYPYYPLAGYKLAPKSPAIIALGLTADTAGAFLVGPVTVHAEVPLVSTSGPGIPIQVTYSQYATLCVQLPMQTCDQWSQEQIPAIQAGTVQHAPGIIYSTSGTGL